MAPLPTRQVTRYLYNKGIGVEDMRIYKDPTDPEMIFVDLEGETISYFEAPGIKVHLKNGVIQKHKTLQHFND